MRRWLAIAIAVAAPSARAEPESTRLFEEGRALAKQGDYLDACNLFTQSFALDPAPGTELNLGDCHEHLGHLVQAWHHFDVAARKFAHAHDDRASFARDRRDAITPRLATVVVHVADPHVRVIVAGADQPAGRELTVQVDPGDVVVRAGDATWHVQVAPGGTASVDVPAETHAEVRSEVRRGRTRLAYTLAGAGVVTGVIGIALGLSAKSQYDDQFANGNCVKTASGPMCNFVGLLHADDAISKANWGTRFGVVSVLALGAGTIVYLTAPRERVIVSPTASTSAAGLVVSGSF